VSQIDEIFVVLGVTVVAVCGLFIGMIINMEKEHKREKNLHKTRDNKSSSGQPDQSVHDVTSRTSTTPASPTASTQGEGSV
jgi:hypothetical protein